MSRMSARADAAKAHPHASMTATERLHRVVHRARYAIPRGRSLPGEAWTQRHRGVVVLLWAHAVGLTAFGILTGSGFEHSATEGGVVAASAVLASWERLGRRVRAVIASLGLVSASAILVHFSGGYIEMHFHFFVMVTVIALYQDWVPFLAAIGYVVLHHGTVGALAPASVYNHASAIAHPWQWATIHAAFVLAASVASITNWRVHEAARARTELILNSAGEGICGVDAQGTVEFINPAGARMIGYEREELIGRPLRAMLRPASADGTPYASWQDCPIARPFRDGGVHDVGGDVFQRCDGTTFPVEYVSTPIHTEGKVAGVVVTFKDITERKVADAAMAERARVAALGGDVGAALSSDTLPSMLRGCTEAFVRHLDVMLARVWVLNESEGALDLLASATSAGLDLPATMVSIGAPLAAGIARARGPHLTNDLTADADVDGHERAWARRAGVSAFAGYPLVVQDRLVGVMGLFARAPFTPSVMEAMASVAVGIAQGIERTRTEQALRHSEDQLRQSQKMDAIGRLAGGVAHDINNLLTVIMGQTDFVLKRLEAQHPLRKQLEEASKAAERAAKLPRQLLAFSRKQVLQPVVVNLNTVVDNVTSMLRMMIGEDIELSTVLDPALGRVKVDPGQVEQVIMNLAVNARDAMPQGGHLTIDTANVELDAAYARLHSGVVPGSYVMLAVSDTGCGMDAEVRSHLFEPFFTTKEQGKGTGLGLSTVYGIVKQSGGYVWVYSEPGQGATFKIYFPRLEEAALAPAQPPGPRPERGHETVLLVEDDPQVRSLAGQILRENGYRVLEASDGREACGMTDTHPEPIKLLVTDVVMPRMSGRELAERLTASLPGLRVLYMSGYTDSAIAHHGVLDAEKVLLQKPFTEDALVRKVRDVLDSVV
jgi:PAS domain S-box-containing protein